MATKTTVGFDPAIPLTKIHQHPKNPRRNATASDELVASVKAQGLMQALVVAPHPEIAGEYVLIAGHRRRDALTRAGVKTAKAEIRDDLVTEVQQIESMLIENSARADLTAIEEAEAYEQLQLFNLKPADIAKAVGKSRQTVTGRLKLLALSEKARTKIHDGQITIDDALALADLPKAAREKVEGALGTSDFRWKLTQERDRIKQAERHKAEIKVAAELGILPYADEPVDIWQLSRDGVVLRLNGSVNDATIVQVIDQHTACLRWCESGSYNGIPNMHLVCADPDSHVDENASPSTSVDAERAAREARWEAQRAEREAKAEADRVAAQLRWETLAAANPATALRYILPVALWSLECLGVDMGAAVDEHLGIEDAGTRYDVVDPYWQKLMAALDKASDEDVCRVLVAIAASELTTQAQELQVEGSGENLLLAHAFDGLRQLGHQFSDVDTALEAAALGHHGDEAGDE